MKLVQIKHIILLLILLSLAACETSPFWNPWPKKFTIQTVRVPSDFDWSLKTMVDLQVEMHLQGVNLEPIEGQRVFLLDTAQQVLSRGIITNRQCRIFHEIPVSMTQVIVHFPTTGNYTLLSSKNFTGNMSFPYAWQTPEENNGLNYLEIIYPDNQNEQKSASHRLKASAFGNSDFTDNNLIQTDDYDDNFEDNAQWYVTTRNKGPASIDYLNDDLALKLGQNNNKKVEVFQTISWTEEGDFAVSLQAISPDEDRIKLKLYLYYLDQSGKRIKQRTKNYNLKDPEGWQTLSVNGEVPDETSYIKLIIQDQGAKNPYYIDNITSTHIENPDSDDDGIPDKEDDYPQDANKAFNEYFPGNNEFGTLAFEDLWPSTGDYDFNDLVVDYRFNQVRNADYEIVEIMATFYLRAIGGSFHNGFGFELPFDQSYVASVNGQALREGIVDVRSNGTESGCNKAVIIVFEDAWNYLRVSGASFVNTYSNQAQTDPYEFSIRVELNRSLTDEEIETTPPYNPFIFINGQRHREVHLHGFTPTDLMETDLLGTGDDYSNPQNAEYFKTAANLPWALDIPASFDYPEEKSPIDQAYLHFINWAETSGTIKTDWYQKKDGYRNPQKIFQKK